MALSLTLPAAGAAADCFFIGLRKFEIAKGSDLFRSGDISPLIALEPGHFYPLAPQQMEQAPQGEAFPGQFYYIPRGLVDAQQQFSLRMMVLDRDKDTPDDLVLPLTQRLISLAAEHFDTDARRVSVSFMPFVDDVQPESNRMQFEFELRKRAGPCDEDTPEGRTADLGYRRQNELKRLLTRVVFYDQPHLVGGQEYLPYRTAQFKEHSQSTALAKAFDVASVNAAELIALGEEIRSVQGSPDFDDLWAEYVLLVQRLAQQQMIVQYMGREGALQSMSVPSLAFHGGWNNHAAGSPLPVLPEGWGIRLPER